MNRNAAASGSAKAMCQPHRKRMTTNARIESIAMVAVTAMPYAAARLLDEPKPTTSAMIAASSTQLIHGR